MARNRTVEAAIRKAGSQRALAEQMGVSKSLVGRWYRGERSSAKWEPAIRDYAAGRSFTPPGRRPGRVRGKVRNPTDTGSRVVMKGRGARGKLIGQEIRRARRNDREPRNITITGTFARRGRANSNDRRGGGEWTEPLMIEDPTDEQLDLLADGDYAAAIAMDENLWWVGDVDTVQGITWEE